MVFAVLFAVTVAVGLHVGDVAGEVFAVFEEPFEAFGEAGEFVKSFFFKNFGGEEGNEADQRADAEGDIFAGFRAEVVVVEAILFVPEAGAAEGVGGIHDGDEVLEEFGGYVFVGGVVGGEFNGDGEHGGAVEGHPGGAVGLF